MGTRGRSSLSQSISGPVGGWNSRDPLDVMPATDAIRLDNFFPNPSRVELRKGSAVHSTGIGAAAVDTLCEFSSGATRRLIAAGGGALYNAAAGVAVSLATGFTVNQWQHVNFKGYLFLVNGTDQPQKYDGTSLTSASFSGISDDNLFINISVYKQRLYFVEKATSKFWYAAADATSGACTSFDVSNYTKLGGQIVYAGPWNNNAGTDLQNYFAAITNMGEVLVFGGEDPGDASWELKGTYQIAPPLGYRAFIPYGSDLVILTTNGIYPLSKIMTEGQAEAAARINEKIAPTFQQRAMDYDTQPGWCGLFAGSAQQFIVNVPLGSAASEQHVMNITSGAWCRFLGLNARCWSLYDGDVYFGDNFGRVIKANTGSQDITNPIQYDLKTAFNYLGDRSSYKRFLMAKPVISTSATVRAPVSVDVDFKDDPLGYEALITSGGTPWEAPWGSPWTTENVVDDEWRAVCGLGRAVAMKMRGKAQGVSFAVQTFHLIYEPGGLM